MPIAIIIYLNKPTWSNDFIHICIRGVKNLSYVHAIRGLTRELWIVINATIIRASQWRHDERDGVSNHERLDCLLNRLFRRRSTKTSKLRVTGLWGNPPVTDEFSSQLASNTENVSIWWRLHEWHWFKTNGDRNERSRVSRFFKYASLLWKSTK